MTGVIASTALRSVNLEIPFDLQTAGAVEVVEPLDLVPVAVDVADDEMAGVQPAEVLAAAHFEHPRAAVGLDLPALDAEVVGDLQHADQLGEEVAFFELLQQ